MMTFFKTAGVAAAMAATTLGFTQNAEAQDRWHHRGGNDAAIAIGAGILGLAVGAAIADRNDDRYYDRRYYNNRRYVTVRGRPEYYYYYDNAPRRYYQDRYYGRPGYRDDRGYYREDRGYYRGERGYDRNRGYYRDDHSRSDRGYDQGPRHDRRGW